MLYIYGLGLENIKTQQGKVLWLQHYITWKYWSSILHHCTVFPLIPFKLILDMFGKSRISCGIQNTAELKIFCSLYNKNNKMSVIVTDINCQFWLLISQIPNEHLFFWKWPGFTNIKGNAYQLSKVKNPSDVLNKAQSSWLFSIYWVPYGNFLSIISVHLSVDEWKDWFLWQLGDSRHLKPVEDYELSCIQ